MDWYEAVLAAIMIAGLSGLIFLVGACVSDLLIPWFWRYRCRRIQARYRNRR